VVYHEGMIDEPAIRGRFEALRPRLDERGRRLFCAAEARTAGDGGVTVVARATGVARSTINRGLKDLQARDPAPSKVRRSGGGRPALTQTDPTLLEDLRALLESTTLGDPMQPLFWVSKSHAKLAQALRERGHRVSASRIPPMARSPRLPPSGQPQEPGRRPSCRPERSIRAHQHASRSLQAAGDPGISVDTKKKELVGPYKNAGSDYRPKACPDKVNVHDFVDKELGKAIPYGVYDIGANVGCVSVGINHDTAQFAVNAIRRWRDTMGRERYPKSVRLMIAADGGGSNGSRVSAMEGRTAKVRR